MPEGLRIAAVAPGSTAAQMQLRPGDRITAMQGEPVVDLVDYLFFAGDGELRLTVERPDGSSFETTAASGGGLQGITLEPGQLRLRTCCNHCLFCFVDQMPPGFRPGLYIKDDDWRTSFLHGSYVTLTNLTEQDYSRILSRRVSPLYVSVHATDDNVREMLLGSPRARGILDTLKRLAAGGTAFHAQAVIVEGVNDGEVLERTIRDLSELHPWAQSLALVPVGLTSSREGLARIRPLSRGAAAAVVDLTERLQAEFLEKTGTRFVFASDEFYLQAGRPVPPAASYEDFSQLENGVGLAADFQAAAEEAIQEGGSARPGSFLLATGLGIAEPARRLAARLRAAFGVDLEVRGIPNATFGSHVNVTGLLTGRDVVSALASGTDGRTLLLPDVMFRDGGGVTLDNMTPVDIGRQVGAPCIAVSAEGGAFVRSLVEPKGMKEDHV